MDNVLPRDPWFNGSKANIRLLQTRTAARDEDCRQAPARAGGDLMGALRLLAPDVAVTKYHDLYYLGPFERVAEPDRDLPRRHSHNLSPHETAIEIDRDMGQGERLLAPFNDANSLEDISGGLLFAGTYPDGWDERERYEFPTIQGLLAQVADRIRHKLRRNKNPVRGDYFLRALQAVELAKDVYFEGNYQAGEDLVWEAHDLLCEGNKQRRPRGGSH